MLDIRNLTMRFGGLTAVDDVSFGVEPGRIVSLIGPNGAGKTTAFNAVTGIYTPTSGKILFEGREPIRPISPRIYAAFAAIGLLTALSAMIVFSNLDTAWNSVVNQPAMRDEFTWSGVPSALWEYLQGPGLQVVPRNGDEWSVVGPRYSADSFGITDVYGTTKSRADAETLLARIPEGTIENSPAIPPLDVARYRDLADEPKIDALRRTMRDRIVAETIGFCGGLAIGVFGAWSIWSRGRRAPNVCAERGMARTFQNIRLFREMTVRENVLVGLDRSIGGGLFSMALRLPGQRRREAAAIHRAEETLAFVGLADKAKRLAGSLAYGDQRRLEIARALATDPKLLLLDEPGAGMNPSETADLIELIRKIRDGGKTILLIEHHMNVVMGISDKIVVLEYGRKIAEGTPALVRDNPQVIEAYLGKDEE